MMLHNTAELRKRLSDNAALGSAIVLAKVWMLRRKLHLCHQGIHSFHICALMCYLEDLGAITHQMSPWEIFKNFLVYISQSIRLNEPDMLTQAARHPILVSGAVLGKKRPAEPMAVFLSAFDVVLLDTSAQLNTMARVSKSGFAQLQMQASKQFNKYMSNTITLTVK